MTNSRECGRVIETFDVYDDLFKPFLPEMSVYARELNDGDRASYADVPNVATIGVFNTDGVLMAVGWSWRQIEGIAIQTETILFRVH